MSDLVSTSTVALQVPQARRPCSRRRGGDRDGGARGAARQSVQSPRGAAGAAGTHDPVQHRSVMNTVLPERADDVVVRGDPAWNLTMTLT